MAEGNQDGGNKGGSLIKQAFVTAPLVAGAGIAARNVIHSGAVNPPRTPAITSAIHSASAARPSKAPPMINFQRHINWMRKNPGITQEAWTMALAGIDPLSRQNILSKGGNITGLDAADMLSSIESTMKGETSNLARKGFRKFFENIETFQKHLEITGTTSLPAFADVQGQLKLNPIYGYKIPSNIQKYVDNISSSLGKKPDVHFFSREGWKNADFGMYDINFKSSVGNIRVQLPNIVDGILVEGFSQQTKRIAPRMGMLDLTTGKVLEMSRAEFFLQELERTALTDFQTGAIKTQSEFQSAVNRLYHETFQQLEVVTNVPEGIEKTEALKTMEATRSKAIQIRVLNENRAAGKAGTRIPTSTELQQAITAGGYFGGTSPDALAEGIVQTENLAKRLMVESAADTSRRLEQGAREYESITGEKFQGRTMYIDFDKYPELRSELNLAEGEMIARESFLRDMGEVQANKSLDLSRTHLTPEGLIGKEFQVGEVLGYDPHTKEPITYQSNMRMLGARYHETKGKGEFLRLHYMDTQRIIDRDKFFVHKATLRITNNNTMNRVLNSLGKSVIMANNIDLIGDIKTLPKNKALHAEQIVTGIQGVLEARPEARMTSQGRRFMTNPMGWVNAWEQASLTHGSSQYDHEEFIRQAKQFAIGQAGFTSFEADTVFGDQGFAFGKAELVYDAPSKLKGAGAIGSIEPRAFDIFKGKSWAIAGESVTQDIMSRLAMTNPEKLALSGEIGKTIQSFEGKVTRSGEEVFDVANRLGQGDLKKQFRTFVDEGGGFIRPGASLPEVYVPSAETATTMREIKTHTGKVSTSLFDDYMNIVRSSAAMHSDVTPTTIAETRSAIQESILSLGKQWAPAGKGMGSYTRGRLLGSRYLRNVGAIGEYASKDPNIAYITEDIVAKMNKEMTELGVWSVEESAERAKILQEGGSIPGLVMRHPNISEHSGQTMMLKIAKGEKGTPSIALPSTYVNLGFQPDLGLGETKIQIGPNVGMGADADGDNIVVSFLAPDAEKKARQQIFSNSSEYTQRHMQHQVRMQLLEAGAKTKTDAGISIEMKRLADIEKLSATKKYVPQISIQLSEARRALLEFGKGESAERAKDLLTHLEQTPIGAKHLQSMGIVEGGFESMMDSLTAGFQKGGTALEQQAKNVLTGMAGKGTAAAELLTKDLLLDERTTNALSKHYNIQAESRIRGFRIDDDLREISRSLGEYRNQGASKAANLMRGRNLTKGNVSQLVEMAGHTAAQATGEVSGNLMSRVTKAATATSNRLGAIGRSAIKNYKPLALGFAASLGLAATLSSPKDTIGPGSALRNVKMNVPRSKASNRMKPETVMPQGQTLGNPTAPNMLRSKSVSIDSATNYPQSRVTMRAPANTNVSSMAARIRGVSGQNGAVHLNLKDNRSSLNSRNIYEKLLG